jgi:hypothetical protein
MSFTPLVKRSLPAMEFCADFLIVLKRELPPHEWLVLELYHLKGIDYRRCALRMHWALDSFYSRLYTVEGHAGKCLQDFGLYPIHKYFNSSERRKSVYLDSIEKSVYANAA